MTFPCRVRRYTAGTNYDRLKARIVALQMSHINRPNPMYNDRPDRPNETELGGGDVIQLRSSNQYSADVTRANIPPPVTTKSRANMQPTTVIQNRASTDFTESGNLATKPVVQMDEFGDLGAPKPIQDVRKGRPIPNRRQRSATPSASEGDQGVFGINLGGLLDFTK